MPIFRRTGPTTLELLGMHIGFGRIGSTAAGAAFFVPIARCRSSTSTLATDDSRRFFQPAE